MFFFVRVDIEICLYSMIFAQFKFYKCKRVYSFTVINNKPGISKKRL